MSLDNLLSRDDSNNEPTAAEDMASEEFINMLKENGVDPEDLKKAMPNISMKELEAVAEISSSLTDMLNRHGIDETVDIYDLQDPEIERALCNISNQIMDNMSDGMKLANACYANLVHLIGRAAKHPISFSKQVELSQSSCYNAMFIENLLVDFIKHTEDIEQEAGEKTGKNFKLVKFIAYTNHFEVGLKLIPGYEIKYSRDRYIFDAFWNRLVRKVLRLNEENLPKIVIDYGLQTINFTELARVIIPGGPDSTTMKKLYEIFSLIGSEIIETYTS